ncbi:MAG: barnase inhibitor [Clostridiaceae bacterium]|mgnify:CR=1 FL=1|nr:barnase inhibitor [Clostridiaceae bacterium]
MKKIRLDFKDITSNVALHNLLKDKLDLASEYASNLDSLWDCLLEIDNYMLVELININYLYQNLGSYGAKVLGILDDMTQENPCFWLKLLQERL